MLGETHNITIEVALVMDEMDGSPEESAEIARTIIEDLIFEHYDANAVVEVTGFQKKEN